MITANVTRGQFLKLVRCTFFVKLQRQHLKVKVTKKELKIALMRTEKFAKWWVEIETIENNTRPNKPYSRCTLIF